MNAAEAPPLSPVRQGSGKRVRKVCPCHQDHQEPDEAGSNLDGSPPAAPPNEVHGHALTCTRPLTGLTWLQQQALHGRVQEPLEPLVLLLGAQDLALVLLHGLLHGAQDLLRGRRQPLIKKGAEQLQLAHVDSSGVGPVEARPRVYIHRTGAGKETALRETRRGATCWRGGPGGQGYV